MHNVLITGKDFRVAADEIYLNGNVNMTNTTLDELTVNNNLQVGEELTVKKITMTGGPLLVSRTNENTGWIQLPDAYNLNELGEYRLRYAGDWVYYYIMEGACGTPDPAGVFFNVMFERRNESVILSLNVTEDLEVDHTVTSNDTLRSVYVGNSGAGVHPGFRPKRKHKFKFDLILNTSSVLACQVILWHDESGFPGLFEITRADGSGFAIGEVLRPTWNYAFVYNAEDYDDSPPVYPDIPS